MTRRYRELGKPDGYVDGQPVDFKSTQGPVNCQDI